MANTAHMACTYIRTTILSSFTPAFPNMLTTHTFPTRAIDKFDFVLHMHIGQVRSELLGLLESVYPFRSSLQLAEVLTGSQQSPVILKYK